MPNLPAGVIDVTEAELPAVRAYLEARIETSLFLLSTLRAFGPRQGDSPYSGDVRALLAPGGIQAVWCLTRGGHLVVQGDGRVEQAPIIEADTAGRGMDVRGVLGDWPVAEALWRLVCDRHGLVVTQHSREVLYRLVLGAAHAAGADRVSGVRSLTPSDTAAWDPLAAAFLHEQRLPVGTAEGRRAGFETSARNGHWWGGWDGDRLVSIASFNAFAHPAAQVGGVYTIPDCRRQGRSRAVMRVLLRDAVTVHRLTRVILFTGEQAHPARALYESLGFETCGAFGLFFGERRNEAGG